MVEKDFELLPHTADLKIRVYGKTLKDFFRHALIGMFQSVRPKTKDCTVSNGRLVCKNLSKQHNIKIEGSDRESLLVNFLSHALSLSDINNEAYLDVTIDSITDTSIKAVLQGVPIDGFEVVEIKAVTYYGLEIKKSDDGWVADIVFDI